MPDCLTPKIAREILAANGAQVNANEDAILSSIETQTLRVLLETTYGLNRTKVDLFFQVPEVIAEDFPLLAEFFEPEEPVEPEEPEEPGDGEGEGEGEEPDDGENEPLLGARLSPMDSESNSDEETPEPEGEPEGEDNDEAGGEGTEEEDY